MAVVRSVVVAALYVLTVLARWCGIVRRSPFGGFVTQLACRAAHSIRCGSTYLGLVEVSEMAISIEELPLGGDPKCAMAAAVSEPQRAIGVGKISPSRALARRPGVAAAG